MRYIPHTPDEIRQMLTAVGVERVDDLFESVPPAARLKGRLRLPEALSEPELMRHMDELSASNQAQRLLSFLGAGSYAHHIPPAVDQLLLRSEFYTAYTPYQPEVAQGTLQAIWEFQTIVSELYGLPLANASMYDGASAAAEGAQMAQRLTRRGKVLLSGCLHPDYQRVLCTYLGGQPATDVQLVPAGPDGTYSPEAFAERVGPDVAAVVVGYPAFTGGLRDLKELAELAHAQGALLVTSTTEPYCLGVVQSPGAAGADIATGEGQALATAPNFGGPGVGLFACRQDRKYLQQLPGRVCGETVDQDGKRGFVLTLSTREQHIRRERATSNICTNQGLIALALTIRTCLLGKQGFRRTAQTCLAKAEYLKQKVHSLEGYELISRAPTFNEFAVRVKAGSAQSLCAALESEGIQAGLDLGRVDPKLSDQLLLAVTELHSRQDLDKLTAALESYAASAQK